MEPTGPQRLVNEACGAREAKQPEKNRKMKMVEHFLHAYFIIRNPKAETIIYDARFKIPDIAGPGKVMYNKRKKASIERCQEFIWNNTVNAHWIPIFNASKKKDDLADTVMQAISFTKRIEPMQSVSKKSKKLVPRKPNENQKRTRYSKSNLAYVYKNKKNDEDLEKNKRFMKDMKRLIMNRIQKHENQIIRNIMEHYSMRVIKQYVIIKVLQNKN